MFITNNNIHRSSTKEMPPYQNRVEEGKEKPLLRGHPWVFSGAVGKVEGEVSPGDVGEVYSREGQFLGLGHLNPAPRSSCAS